MTTRDMEAAAKVMCHELAHQWFGDLVTTAWWDDLFLNEGFADYFMTFIQQPVYPIQANYLVSNIASPQSKTSFNSLFFRTLFKSSMNFKSVSMPMFVQMLTRLSIQTDLLSMILLTIKEHQCSECFLMFLAHQFSDKEFRTICRR